VLSTLSCFATSKNDPIASRISYRDKHERRKCVASLAGDVESDLEDCANYRAYHYRCVNYLVLTPAFLLAAPARGNAISQTCFVLRAARRQGGGTQTCEARRPLAPVRIGLLLFKSADRRVVRHLADAKAHVFASLGQSRSAPRARFTRVTAARCNPRRRQKEGRAEAETSWDISSGNDGASVFTATAHGGK